MTCFHLFIFGFPFCFLFPAVPGCSDIVFSHFSQFLFIVLLLFFFLINHMLFFLSSYVIIIFVKFFSGFPMFPPCFPMIFSDIFLISHRFPKGRSFPRCARSTRRVTRWCYPERSSNGESRGPTRGAVSLL